MNDARSPDEQPAARRRLGPVTALAAGSLAGLVLGFGGMATAQTAETPAPSPSTSATPEVQSEDDAARDDFCDEDASGADGSNSTDESSGSADSAA